MLPVLARFIAHPAIAFGLVAVLVVILIGSSVPPPENWFAKNPDKVVDVDVHSAAHWPVGGGSWTLDHPSTSVSSSSWLGLGAWFTNTLDFSSSSLRITIDLEDATSHAVLREVSQHTGTATIFGATTTIHAVFREVHAGAYVLHIAVHNDDGTVLAETRDQLLLVPTGGS